VAGKKSEQITQGKEWRNEAIRGKLTALVEKQQRSNIRRTGVLKKQNIPVEQRRYSMINQGKSLK